MTGTATDDRSTWLGFSLKGQRYAVSLAAVREVIRPGDITPVPGAPYDVLGIVNLQLAQERWPTIRFSATREHAASIEL